MDGGDYALVVYLDRLYQIQVGKLGRFAFPPGYYLYLGSARRGLEARLARHFRREKKLHWHIDYLLQQGMPVEAWYALSEERLECSWAKALLKLPDAKVVAPRFGASDCRCPAHLIYLPYRLPLEALRSHLGGAGDGLRPAPSL